MKKTLQLKPLYSIVCGHLDLIFSFRKKQKQWGDPSPRFSQDDGGFQRQKNKRNMFKRCGVSFIIKYKEIFHDASTHALPFF